MQCNASLFPLHSEVCIASDSLSRNGSAPQVEQVLASFKPIAISAHPLLFNHPVHISIILNVVPANTEKWQYRPLKHFRFFDQEPFGWGENRYICSVLFSIHDPHNLNISNKFLSTFIPGSINTFIQRVELTCFNCNINSQKFLFIPLYSSYATPAQIQHKTIQLESPTFCQK